MKLSILLVDDEPKVLRGLKAIIGRAGCDWQVVGECGNGAEALEEIHAKKPDAVITDIKMPCMDGLELVEKVRPLYPDIKFIILSGFPDFSFAQQAIRLETVDYILKPPDYRDILKSLKKVEEQKLERESRANREVELEILKKESLGQLGEKFFQENLYRPGMERSRQENAPHLATFFRRFALFLIKLDNFSFLVFDAADDKLKKLSAFRSEVQKAVYERQGYLADLYDGTYCCFMNVSNDSPVYLKGCARELKAELQESPGESLTIGASRVYQSPEGVNAAYKECLSILRNKVFYEKGSILHISELVSGSSPEGYPLELEHKYIESLRFADNGKSVEILESILKRIIAVSRSNPVIFKSLVMEFVIAVARSLSEDRSILIPGFTSDAGIYGKLTMLDNIDDIRSLLVEYTGAIMDYFAEKNKPGCRKIINDIKAHIQANYFKDISLRQISRDFFMNESYLSDLFKRETSYSFSSYLTRVRMEQARALLGQMDLKPHEISEMVGYNNSRYFNKVFKKYTGMSPFEYRERMLNHG